MDGLQIDDRPHEKSYFSGGHDKMVAPDKVMTAAYPYEPVDSQPGEPQPSASRLPWRLSVLAYTLVVAGVTLLICGAAFGGALGGVVTSHKHSDSNTPATTTVTATVTNTVSSAPTTQTGLVNNYSPLLPDQVNTTALDCAEQATITSRSDEQYQLNCNINYPDNDLLNFIAYSLDDCIDACSSINTVSGDTQCHGVVFNANLEKSDQQGHGNCWLKSIMANPTTDPQPPSVGAVLLS
ncbi:hypothetical protein A1O1_03560 [Capronia coronata CBS 617.96]|uniref:Apple domain-containing protein n=1 Tax=Capronia coronata CBS 617.96 TaxID=1182541 RepID=W9YD76_9EURO|nr:uncharacterized protein A1O1_03560 [Capronia coronata CBS 617.96]EXJ90458.1 hypothetical protein A1O1_03560 [Capronia coronata CBS 617.96]